MANKKLPPIAGINVVQEDARLEANDGSYIYVREAVNIDITESGKAKLRPGLEQSTQIQFKYLKRRFHLYFKVICEAPHNNDFSSRPPFPHIDGDQE